MQLALAGLVALAGLIGALLMHVELWSPGSLWSAIFYARALELHVLSTLALGASVLAGGVGYAAIARLVGAERLRVPWLGWLGLAAYVVGIVATVLLFVQVARDTGWSLYTTYDTEPTGLRARAIAMLAFSIAGLVYALHLTTFVIDHLRAKPVRLAIAIVIIAAVAIPSARWMLWTLTETGIVSASYPLPPMLGQWALLAALALATATLVGDDSSSILAVFALAAGGSMTLTGVHLFGLAVVGLWIALAIQGGIRRPVVALVLAGCGPSLTISALSQLLPGDHLHDTYVDVARHHALAITILFALLATLAAFGQRAPHPRLTWIATLVTTIGFVDHLVMSIHLGISGMPRRYWDYDPVFTAGHHGTGIAALVIVLGLVLLAIAWVLGRPRDPLTNRLPA